MPGFEHAYVVAANTNDVAGEREFATNIEPSIHEGLNGQVVGAEVVATGLGVVHIQLSATTARQATTAQIALVLWLRAKGHQILDERPLARIDTGAVPSPAEVAVPAAKDSASKRVDQMQVARETRLVTITGTPEQVKRMWRYLSSLTGVVIGGAD